MRRGPRERKELVPKCDLRGPKTMLPRMYTEEFKSKSRDNERSDSHRKAHCHGQEAHRVRRGSKFLLHSGLGTDLCDAIEPRKTQVPHQLQPPVSHTVHRRGLIRSHSISFLCIEVTYQLLCAFLMLLQLKCSVFPHM